MTVLPGSLSFRILQEDPRSISARKAVGAVRAWLGRRHPALAGTVKISAVGERIRFLARGEAPQATLDELRDILLVSQDLTPTGQIEVDPAEFEIEPAARPDQGQPERYLLSSHVRRFPYPECEWFDIDAGLLTLTDRRIIYEPDHVVIGEQGNIGPKGQDIPLSEITRVYSDQWWDVPCIMIATERATHRFGWAAHRQEEQFIFDIAEWLNAVRHRLAKRDDQQTS